MTLSEARAAQGSEVVYHGGDCNRPDPHGIIDRTANGWVFVRYDGDDRAKATAAEALSLVGEPCQPPVS